jgi:hypothetical protein
MTPMNATEVMETLRVDDLKAIAKRAGLSKTITRKPDLVAALNHFIETEPAQFVQGLAPTERSFLAEAIFNNNSVNPEVFSAKYNVDCPHPGASGKNCSLLNMVIARDRDASEIYVARTISQILRPLLEKPAPPQPVKTDAIPETFDPYAEDGGTQGARHRPVHIYAGEQTVFPELRRVLQLVQGGKVRVQPKSGRPTPATEKMIAASLVMPDFDLEPQNDDRGDALLAGGAVRAHAWAVLVQQCDWCKASGETLKLTRDGEQLLKCTTPEAFRDGVQSFCSDDKFDEMHRINNIKGQTGKGRRLTDPSERRDSILDGIAEWPLNDWMELGEAHRYLSACGHTFFVANNLMSLYFAEQRYGFLDDDVGLDRQYLRVLLFESLATLGLVDVAYVYPHFLWPELGGGWGTDEMDFCGRYDGLLYVRLNPLGLYCLGRSGNYSPPAAEKRELFIVQPNHEIVVPDRVRLLPGDVSMLERFACRDGEHVWRIDKPLVLDYLESGGSLEEISRFLADNAAQEIPRVIQSWFDDLNARSRAIVKTEDAWLVEFQDPAVAALVAHDSKAGTLCLLAGERHVAVAKGNERAFRTAVKKLGYVVPRS